MTKTTNPGQKKNKTKNKKDLKTKSIQVFLGSEKMSKKNKNYKTKK